MPAARTTSSHQRQAMDKCLADLPVDAPIRTVLQSPAVEAKLAAFDMADAAAIAEQRRYGWWGRLGLRATTLGTFVGALLLLPLAVLDAGPPRTIIGGLQTLALAVTFAATLLIGWLKPMNQWMQSRAEAERLRGEIFAAILAAAPPAGVAPNVLAKQKLALMEKAHFEDQLEYYDRNVRRHTIAASQGSPLRIVSYALIAGAALIGIAALLKVLAVPLPEPVRLLVDFLVQPDANRWQLGMSTIAASMLAHVAARSLMDQDERNAMLYRATTDKVRGLLASELAPAHAAAAAGDLAKALQLFTAVRAVFEQEHAVWFYARPVPPPVEPAS